MKEEAPLSNPFIREPRGGRPAKDRGWPTRPCGQSPSILSQGCGGWAKREIVEGKGGNEGEGGRPTTNLWLTSHAWPPLNPYFHPPLYLAPIMLTPLTKSIKSKANSFHLFPKFFLFIYLKFLDFILGNDEINML
jgi:hypothetical protein